MVVENLSPLEIVANVLLQDCLKLKADEPLFISATYEVIDFVRIVTKQAYKLGVKDIYYDFNDPILKHDALKNLSIEELKTTTFWNKEIWNEYAKKGAAFLMLASETPGLMNDIDSQKISKMTMYAYDTRKDFDDLRDKALVPWCIAVVPTKSWSEKVFPNSLNPVEDMWKTIFNICYINDQNPREKIENHIKSLSTRAQKLNNYHFKELRYKNKLGTNFKIGLANEALWQSGKSIIKGEDILVNFPTMEVFTSPTYDSANGIVYASLPLSYQDNIIKDFYIEFKNGIATNWDAKEGLDTLTNIITETPNANRIGEIALVENSSPISKEHRIFFETLLDENAACHIALGAGFPECIKDSENKSLEELEKYKLNNCKNHVDFMIGTSDMEITGIDTNGREIPIFKNGNFTEEFE